MNQQKNKNYYGFKNKQQTLGGRGERYVPHGFGKALLYVTAPSAIIALVSILSMFVLKGNAQAVMFIVALATFAISLIGSILLMIDIVRFNRRKTKQYGKATETKELDIMRIVHLLIGILCGIIIGYLIWGAKR